jgi:AraC-like DNA-binding protein/quercetin dioxygenase-like cupin family protein
LYASRRVDVSASAANDMPGAANVPVIDLRRAPAVTAGTFVWDGPDTTTGWHRHAFHQIEYALHGVAEVETETAHYLLPPQQAIWLPAGLPHRTTVRNVRSIAVFFDPERVQAPDDRARVVAVAPVAREMMVHAVRWPISRAASERRDETFFDALAAVVLESLADDLPFWLPTTTDPVIAEVIAYTNEHLATVTASDVCNATGISERTLRRRFAAEVGITWRAYLLQNRLFRAMALLADGNTTVLQVASTVGFDSPSAFNRAFRAWTGQSPSAYRRTATAAATASGSLTSSS